MPTLYETILSALHARFLVVPAAALRGDVLPERRLAERFDPSSRSLSASCLRQQAPLPASEREPNIDHSLKIDGVVQELYDVATYCEDPVIVVPAACHSLYVQRAKLTRLYRHIYAP